MSIVLQADLFLAPQIHAAINRFQINMVRFLLPLPNIVSGLLLFFTCYVSKSLESWISFVVAYEPHLSLSLILTQIQRYSYQILTWFLVKYLFLLYYRNRTQHLQNVTSHTMIFLRFKTQSQRSSLMLLLPQADSVYRSN